MNNSHIVAIALMIAIMVIMAQSLSLTSRALKDEIINLPGAPKDLPFRQFSGYIDVEDAVGKASVFYWLVLAIKVDPATAPLTWWTNGGPGCSGLIGKFTENGPFHPKKDGTLALREFPWNDYSNIVFVEQPDVGFTNIIEHTVDRWDNEMVAERNSVFIKNFFERYPEFKKNPFFISSESMGGHYLPTLSNVLIRKGKELGLDYRGLFVGNPLIYLPFNDYGFFRTFIDRQLIPFYPYGKEYIDSCTPDVNTPHTNPPPPQPTHCWDLEVKMRAFIRRIDVYAMSFPTCVDGDDNTRSRLGHYGDHILRYLTQASHQSRLQHDGVHTDDVVDGSIALDDELLLDRDDVLPPEFDVTFHTGADDDDDLPTIPGLGDFTHLHTTTPQQLHGYFPTDYQACEQEYTTSYLSRRDVQDALHVEGHREWSMCKNIRYSQTSMADSMIRFYKDNHLRSGGKVKSLVFSGNDDTVCSTKEAQMALFNSNLTMHSNPWRDVTLNGQLIGHRTDFDELSFVTINGAGHMAPSTRPEQTYSLYNSFITGAWFTSDNE